MKTFINKYLQVRIIPPFKIIITNKTTLLLIALLLSFTLTTQAKIKLKVNFLINNTISNIPLEREKSNLYNNNIKKEGDVIFIFNDTKNTSKNNNITEVVHDD